MKVKVYIVKGETNEDIQRKLNIATLQLNDYKRREQLMLGDLGRAGNDICKYAHKIGMLQEENEQLKEERMMLLQHIERSIDDQKVEIPCAVAKAIDWFRHQGLRNEEIYRLASEADDGKYASRLFDWVEGDGDRNLLMGALVNGYTTKDEAAMLLAGVTDIVQKWWLEAPDGRNANNHSDRLAEDICDFIKQREGLPF